MIPFTIEKEISAIFPDIHIGLLSGTVMNTEHDASLWSEIEKRISELQPELSMEGIREIEAIKLGKKAYKMLGKDPNRYRISAEALLRRISKGNGLYRINSLVDLLNLTSITTGITIGGFDRDKLRGGITLGIGRENEEFEAIGRGELNIHRLPVYRDEMSAIGSPTSDCVRTLMSLDTSNFFMIITGFFGPEGLEECMDMLIGLMKKYINGKNFDRRIETTV